LHAVAPNGSARWTFRTGDWVDSSPALGVDGTIYFGSYDKNVYAVNPDGTEKWRFATGGRIFSSPAIGADGTVYVGSGDQRLYAIGRDGVKKWDYLTDGDIQASPSVGADGTVYFASDVTFHALRPDGTGPRWRIRLNSTSASSAAIRGDGAIILGADDGVVRAINPADGSVRWTFDTRTGLGNLIESSPVVGADGSIYIGSFDGNLYKLNGSGSPLSSYASWPAFHGDPQRRGRALALAGSGKLLNLSTRAQVSGTATLITGIVVQGAAARAFLIRGVGPTLAQFGVDGMPDPRLTVYAGSTVVGFNDDWEQNEGGLSVIDTGNAVGAFPLPPGSKDAAIVLALTAGLYTTHISSSDGQGGVVLAEAYDAVGGDPSGRLVNVSTRSQVGMGADALFAGVVLSGTGRSRLLMRAVGPGLTQFGVTNVLARPTMSVFAQGAGGQPQLIRTNTGWTTDGYAYDLAVAAQTVAAFPLSASSADCAAVVTVEPGNYTIQISGVGSTTGEALVEIYILP
jgi:outer membrane protein assembly factor BamB